MQHTCATSTLPHLRGAAFAQPKPSHEAFFYESLTKIVNCLNHHGVNKILSPFKLFLEYFLRCLNLWASFFMSQSSFYCNCWILIELSSELYLKSKYRIPVVLSTKFWDINTLVAWKYWAKKRRRTHWPIFVKEIESYPCWESIRAVLITKPIFLWRLFRRTCAGRFAHPTTVGRIIEPAHCENLNRAGKTTFGHVFLACKKNGCLFCLQFTSQCSLQPDCNDTIGRQRKSQENTSGDLQDNFEQGWM